MSVDSDWHNFIDGLIPHFFDEIARDAHGNLVVYRDLAWKHSDGSTSHIELKVRTLYERHITPESWARVLELAAGLGDEPDVVVPFFWDDDRDEDDKKVVVLREDKEE